MDSIASAVGKKVSFVIDGREYMVPPIGLGILADAESEMLKSLMPFKDEISAIAMIAEFNKDLARELYDQAVSRRESVPAEEVLQWVCRDIKGVAFSVFSQMKNGYPAEFNNGTLTREKVYDTVYRMAQDNMVAYAEFISKRNQASDLEEMPENPTETPAHQG